MSFGPKQIDFKELGIISLSALISGIISSIILIILVFAISNFIDIGNTFEAARVGAGTTNSIFPLVLSVFTFIVSSLVIFLTYFFLNMINPERYKKSRIIFGQIAFFTVFTYLFLVFAYFYIGSINYDFIIYIFLFHVIIVIFGANLIIEILNNYRYVLVSIYGSFVGLFFTIGTVLLIFSNFESGNAKLISLLFLLPLINFMQIFFKGLFDIGYYKYYKISNQDQIGDIFYMIEVEEKEELKEEEEKNSI